jgi:YidC/Oxa1 family membrane protein insertase
MEAISYIWNTIFVNTMTNGLLLLYTGLFSSFGLAIIAFTVITRVATYPLTMRQLRQTQKMTSLQPRMKEIQERFKNDPQRRSKETMRLYKEMGVNPIGCLGPFVIQLPIWIGLFYAINNTLPFTPENLAGLGSRIYSWLPFLHGVVPVDRTFLWMDLAQPDTRLGLPILPALAGATMWIQQKMAMQPSTDPRQQSTQRMMLWMMPIFFVILGFTFPSGLVLYWVISNTIGIVIQYFVSGWGSLRPKKGPVLSPTLVAAPPAKELEDNGERESRDEREDAGGGDRDRPARARRRPRRGRGKRR